MHQINFVFEIGELLKLVLFSTKQLSKAQAFF